MRSFGWVGRRAFRGARVPRDGSLVQVGWLRNWPFPGTNFRMQLSISNEITLKTSPEGFPTLYAYPVKEMESLRTNSWSENNISLGKQLFIPDFEAELIDLNAIVKVKKGGILKMRIRGEEIVYDRNENLISYGNHKVNLLTEGDLHEFRILVDRASIEIFCNGGEIALFLPIDMNREDRKLEFSTSGSTAEIKQLDIYELKSSWEK